jgi:hypothetical protein
MDDTHASEQLPEPAGGDQAGLRKTYVTPRLTRWGAIPRVTEADPDSSAIV